MAAAPAPSQQAAPNPRKTEFLLDMAHLIDSMAQPIVFPLYISLRKVFGAFVVGSAARDKHADALLAERDVTLGGARITDLPRTPRPSAAAPVAISLTLTFDSAAVPARVLAAPNDALPVSQVARQLAAANGSTMLSHQSLLTSPHSFNTSWLFGVLRREA